MNAIEIDGQLIGNRVTLAGEDETLCHFIIFQGIVSIHLNLAGSQVAAAARTNSSLAAVAKIDSVAQTGLEDRFRASRHRKSALRAIE